MDAVETDFTQILKLTNALFAEDIEQVAFSPNFKSQIAALVLSNSDIILWKSASHGENPTMKWVPWKNDPDSKVQAIAFQPISLESVSEDKTELLIITYDGTIYIINVNRILSEEPLQQSYSKLNLNTSTSIPGFVPTAIAWWDSTHYRHKDIAVIGGNKGQIVFFSLTHACYIANLNTESRSPIFSLSICCDFFRDYSYLLITNDLRQQWKLLLEKEINGDSVVLLAFGENEAPSTSKPEKNMKIVPQTQQKSRLQEFKQMSVETFALLKQKLNESRRPNTERPRMGSIGIEHSELQSCDCYGEAFLSVQQYKNRRVLTGLFIPESVLLLYLQSKDSMTLIHHKFKISPLVTTLLLTNAFVYIADIMETQHRILIFSTRLSESKKIEPIEYNPASFVQSFLFPEEERIISLFKMEKKLPSNDVVDTTALSATSDSPHSRPGIKQIRLEDEWNEACLVATNKGIYVISLRDDPVELAMESMGMVKKLSLVFNLSFSKVLEHMTDRLMEEKKIDEALSLCDIARCYSGKITLKLASMGYIDVLLTYTEGVLSLTDLDLPLVERIHLSNFVVTCYAEQYLRDSLNGILHKRFMNFLKTNFHYDEEVNIHILANYKLCSFVHFLTVWRGLYFDGSIALTNLLAQSQTDKFKNVHHFDGFWQLFSEPCLVDAFVLSPRTLHLHIQFLRHHLNEIPSHILKRLYEFYDPTRPVLKPAMARLLKVTRKEYLEAYDFQNDKWGCDANMYDWVTNFLFLHTHMYKYQNFDYALNKYVSGVLHATVPQKNTEEVEVEKLPSTPTLSAGFAHAAVVKNGSLVTWGLAAYGSLGTGPTLSQNCAPVLNTWFEDHRIQVKYVSCGRHHTLAMTENGLYAWGSNKFGQVGIGEVGQSVYPRMIETLASYSIVSVEAGQYHSLAIDDSGRLWSWGWGVYGQLGHGNTDDQYYPKMVEKLKKKIIIHADGGQAHSIVLTKKGKVLTFGCNTFGQLGIGSTIKSTFPVKVFGIQEKIVLVSTNYFHNLVLSESNRLYTWGCSPQILKLQAQSQKRARSMQCFQEKNEYPETTSNNNDSNSVAVEGAPYEHLTATVDNGKHLSPTLVDTTLVQEKIKQVSCGLFHSALLTSNNQIYTWGRNVDGQLGNCKRQTEVSLPTPVNIFSIKLLPTNKQQIDLISRPSWKISCGKDYTLAMELEGRLFGWGNNCAGQLGTLPQEDFSIKRYLNGKFIVNKYAKRMIKVSHGGINIIEKPMEIQGLPKIQLMFNNDENTSPPSSQVECDLDLPGFSQQNYPVIDTKTLFSELKVSGDQVLHYFLECFHGFYNVEFILNTCAENNNYQAMSKICCLNFQFYDAFFYGLKSLLLYVRENYFFNTFKDSYGQSKNRIIPKNITKAKETTKDEAVNTKKTVIFEFMEDIIMEAVYMFENFYKMILKFTPEKIGSFLRKSVSVWIVWELPLQPLEWFFSKNWDQVAYPLAVFLFCDHYKSLTPSNDQELKHSSQIESTSWKDKKRYISTYLQSKKYPLSSKTKYPFLSSTESKACYQDLYQCKSDSHLESDDPKYKLSSIEMLQNLTVQFTLKLCNVIIDSMSMKSNAEYEEFVRLLHEVIFAPSILKSDNRNPDEVFSAALSTLQRSQSTRKKFIHISYDELREQPISNKFIVFSCGHYFISQSVFEKEVNTVVRELDSLRLVSTSELVNRLFSDTCYTTCCPNCLFRYVEYETQ